MLFWIIDLKLLKIGVAIEELLMVGDAIVLDPIVGPNKAIGKPAHVSLPVADKEVEVVRPIARGRRRFTCYCTGYCELQDAQASKLTAISWLEADGDNCTPDLTNSANDASRP